jgi:small subunit ribosomal protein S31
LHREKELREIQKIPPINGFDEMIALTNEGKLWKFPINNEQGWAIYSLNFIHKYTTTNFTCFVFKDVNASDAQTPFYEHVFLDNYLEEFPQIEPIQQFMTLALNGISQNSFLSLSEKKEIIEWYKDYFNDKLDIIKEALEAEKV